MINRELIEVFSEIAREKNIERSELATILEDLFLYVIEKEYGDSSNCSCIVNLDKGEIEIYAEKTIVEEIDDQKVEITLAEAIEKDPSNPILYYNLGVVSADLGENDASIEYYKKSIELDPTNEDSYLNMVAVILEGEEAIVDEMNSLGTSRSDNIRYDELKKIREDLYLQCVPILKKIVDLNQNLEAVRTLMNIYGTLGDNQGYMEMKNLRDQLDQ